MDDTSPDPAGAARAAAGVLAERTGVARHDVAIVLGSGWVPAIDALGTPRAEVPVTELPGFLPPAVEGHAGRVRSLNVAGVEVLAFLGRTHLYDPQWTLHAAADQAYAGPAASWPAPFRAGRRKPPAGRTEAVRPRLELIRPSTPAPAVHLRWRPSGAATHTGAPS